MDGLNLNKMFGAALGLTPPWTVMSVEFNPEAGELNVHLGFPRGSRFACAEQDCPEGACAVHDTSDKTWRHLVFFQHQAYLTARVPRVRCPEHGVHLIAVPWARPGSGFTLLFEVALLTYAREMPVAPLAAMSRVRDTRVWWTINHHVTKVRSGMDFSHVTLTERVCCDMSPAFTKGITTYLGATGDGEEARTPQIVYGRYHVVAQANDAVDQVCRAEVGTRPELKHSKYTWLKNDAGLTTVQRTWLEPTKKIVRMVERHWMGSSGASRRGSVSGCWRVRTR